MRNSDVQRMIESIESGINKKFDNYLHSQYDDVGKNIVISYFQNLGFDARENTDRYGVDVVLYRNNIPIGYAEVEIRNNWNTDVFPFDTLNVPLRKKKLLDQDLPTYFFSINKTNTRMYCCPAEIVLESPVKENPNKYVKEKEYFYKVPLEKLKLIVLP